MLAHQGVEACLGLPARFLQPWTALMLPYSQALLFMAACTLAALERSREINH